MKDLYMEDESTESDDAALSDVIICSYFSDSFIYLANLQQICRLLEKTPAMSSMAEKLVKRILPTPESGEKTDGSTGAENNRDDIIRKINDLVSKEATAEGTFLLT